jgi:L-Ala-D/L-Glu epimerase
MKIERLQTFVVSVPYLHDEVSSRIHRGGVTDVIVKLTTDDGAVGWGESCSGADVASVEKAVASARPFLIGRDPWDGEAIFQDFFKTGLWDFRAPTGYFAFAGIDQALWDLRGKAAGQPVYRLLGGALRDEADYFCYLARGRAEDLTRQCQDGVARGYTCFYLKVGVDAAAETAMLAAIREAIGDERKIRIDANEAWSVPEAVKILRRWDAEFTLDFCEAPVPGRPVAAMREVREQTSVCISANEWLWGPAEVLEMINGRGADVLCFSAYWVGTIRRFLNLSLLADYQALRICKHTHGELGIAAAAGQHVLLTLPNAVDGNQQTASIMEDDILAEPLPIKDGPRWGRPDKPGLGIEIDEQKIARYHNLYKERGQFLPYSNPAPQSRAS